MIHTINQKAAVTFVLSIVIALFPTWLLPGLFFTEIPSLKTYGSWFAVCFLGLYFILALSVVNEETAVDPDGLGILFLIALVALTGGATYILIDTGVLGEPGMEQTDMTVSLVLFLGVPLFVGCWHFWYFKRLQKKEAEEERAFQQRRDWQALIAC